jgi:hypothetical protein
MSHREKQLREIIDFYLSKNEMMWKGNEILCGLAAVILTENSNNIHVHAAKQVKCPNAMTSIHHK